MSTSGRGSTWGADAPVSKPAGREKPVLKDMGGFCWTEDGLRLNLNEEEVEAAFTPRFAPPMPERSGSG